MNNYEVGLFEKVLIKLKSSIKNKNDMEEITEMVKLISVSLYYDKKVTAKEILEADKIVNMIFDSDTSFVSLLIKEKVESYIDEFWLFQQDSEYILKKILEEGNWLYAEYMITIFRSDGLSKEEQKYYKALLHVIDTRKELLKELGLSY